MLAHSHYSRIKTLHQKREIYTQGPLNAPPLIVLPVYLVSESTLQRNFKITILEDLRLERAMLSNNIVAGLLRQHYVIPLPPSEMFRVHRAHIQNPRESLRTLRRYDVRYV
jgi:hypothetical protein